MATLFNSTGNNFGAGTIAFKSHQDENYVVLNAKFTYNPENADYQAADVLEIYFSYVVVCGYLAYLIGRPMRSGRTD